MRYEIGCQLVLINHFRLLPTSVALNDLEQRNGPNNIFALFHQIR